MKTVIANFLSRRSLVWQLTIIFSMIVIIPTIVIMIVLFNNNRSLVLKEADINSSQTLVQVSNAISKNMAITESVATEIFYREELQYYLNDSFPISATKLDFFESTLRTEKANLRNVYVNKFYQMVIYSVARKYPEPFLGVLYDAGQIADRPYYQELIANGKSQNWGSVRLVEPLLEKLGGNITVSPILADTFVVPFYKKVYEPVTNRLLGFLELDLQIEKIIEADTLRIPASQSLFIFNDANALIYSNHPEMVRTLVQMPRLPDGDGVATIDLNQQAYRVNYLTANSAGMRIGTAVLEKTILGDLITQYLVIILAVLLGSFLVILLIYTSSRLLLKRLRLLDHAIENVERGEFNIQLNVQGSDEVSRIGHSFNRMTLRLNEMIHTIVKEETARREAEIHALQAQINPHFLYNTLENIRMECEINEQYELSETLASLGDLLRYSIEWNTPLISLREEIVNLNNYIRIMQMRFRGKFKYVENIEESALNCLVPKMILQPIVENAFNHAFRNYPPPWLLNLAVEQKADVLIIKVQDNGRGITAERLHYLQDCLLSGADVVGSRGSASSIGISNVHRRIKMQFGPGSGLTLESLPGKGTLICLVMNHLNDRGVRRDEQNENH